MFVKTSFLLLLLCVVSRPCEAQQSEAEYLLEASRPVDADRYETVRGTPYRYDAFLPGTLYDTALNPYELDSINLNGFTNQFEYYVDGELRELAGPNFLRVEVSPEDGSKHTYGWNINFKFPNKYAELLIRGDYVTGTMVFEVANDEKVVQDVGKTVKLQRFNSKSHYYAMVDGELIALSSNARRLAEELGFQKELSQFIKENKLKPGRHDDLIEILAQAEELYDTL